MAEKMNIMQKLAKARVMLQKRNLKKSGFNKYAGFKYFELADFLPSINEIFDELGMYAEFKIHEEKKMVYQDGTSEITPQLATLLVIDTDKPDDYRLFSSAVAEAGTKGASPIQQLGSVHTYMRRYLYMEALEIVESDGVDALNGTDNITPAGQQKTEQLPSNDDMANVLQEFNDTRRAMAAKGMDIRDKEVSDFICMKANVTSVDPGKLNRDDLIHVTEVMKAVVKAKK